MTRNGLGVDRPEIFDKQTLQTIHYKTVLPVSSVKPKVFLLSRPLHEPEARLALPLGNGFHCSSYCSVHVGLVLPNKRIIHDKCNLNETRQVEILTKEKEQKQSTREGQQQEPER